jgi:hypothetical protein
LCEIFVVFARTVGNHGTGSKGAGGGRRRERVAELDWEGAGGKRREGQTKGGGTTVFFFVIAK